MAEFSGGLPRGTDPHVQRCVGAGVDIDPGVPGVAHDVGSPG
jgi:hypothetical protein